MHNPAASGETHPRNLHFGHPNQQAGNFRLCRSPGDNERSFPEFKSRQKQVILGSDYRVKDLAEVERFEGVGQG
jgi:hypothetical protein